MRRYSHKGTCAQVRILIAATLVAAAGTTATAQPLVTDATIKTERTETSLHKLKNGIPVLLRRTPDADIATVTVNFDAGQRDIPAGRRVLNQWLWTTVPLAAKGYPKETVYTLTEKLDIGLSCSGGIEMSSCGVSTVREKWDQALALFAALVREPSLTAEDVALVKGRLIAQLKQTPEDPETYVNELLNHIFYPVNHPYRLTYAEALKELDHLGRADLANLHKTLLNARRMQIVVVGDEPEAKVMADLEKAFGTIKASAYKDALVPIPAYDAAHAYIFENREIPTAYLRLKMNGPGIRAKDAVAASFLYDVLSQELEDEVRTKRSLSYAVYAGLLEYSRGIGMISASTSKPKETLEAIQMVLDRFRTKPFSKEELDQYKHLFATSYYETQETNASLAAALGTYQMYFGSANPLYDMPRALDAVTPADIQRLAKQLLVNFRLGVIYDRAKFKDEWATEFIAKNKAAH